MQYAINVADMSRDSFLCGVFISPVTSSRQFVEAEKGRVDGSAILLECDAECADAIVKVIRKKWAKHLIRCYQSKTGHGGWKRI